MENCNRHTAEHEAEHIEEEAGTVDYSLLLRDITFILPKPLQTG